MVAQKMIPMDRTFDGELQSRSIFLMSLITVRKRNLGQGNIFTGVCLSTEEGCLVQGVGMGGLVPEGGSGPGGLPGPGVGVPGGDPPRRLRLWVVRILLECILVS